MGGKGNVQSTVHIIDDNEAIRDFIREVLAENGYWAETYASALDFLAAADRGVSGCVVTDVRMPGMSGIDLLAKLSEAGLRLPVIVITGHANVQLAVQAMKLGAVDLLEKPFHTDDLVAAIRSTLLWSGASESDASVDGRRHQELPGANRLTYRETEVLRLVLSGLTNKAIAREMGISDRTVEAHRAKVMRKTGAKNLADLHRSWAHLNFQKLEIGRSPRESRSGIVAPPVAG